MKRLLPFAAASIAILSGGCSLDSRELTLAVAAEEPASEIAATITAALQARDIVVEVQSIPDPVDAIERIHSGEIDLAIIEEPQHPIAGVITVTPLYPSVLHVLHKREDSPQSFSELIRGTNIYAGPPGGEAEQLLLQLAADFDVDPEQFRLLDNPLIQEPDVYFIFGGLLSPEAISRLAEYQLFDFQNETDLPGGSLADGIVLKHHHLSPFLLPRGVYHSLADDAVMTLSIRTVLISKQSIDEQLTYDIASTVYNQAQEISMHYPLVIRELNEVEIPMKLIMPLHEGSKRYLDRDRPGFVERHVDVLALYFTLFITALTGAFALYRYRSQVRKDRVDVFYSALLAVRDKMRVDGETKRDWAAHHDEVLGIQREVLDLLVDERIAADAGLVAFINLSNQLLGELSRVAYDPSNSSRVDGNAPYQPNQNAL